MAADITQVLRILRYRDIAVRVSGGRLVARARHDEASELVFCDDRWQRRSPEPGPLPADMIAFIQHFRDDIIAYLSTMPVGEGFEPTEGAA